jgi:hypothetical protein
MNIKPSRLCYVPCYTYKVSGNQKLIEGYPYRHTLTHTYRQEGDRISLFLFFLNRKSTLNIPMTTGAL